MLHPVICHLSCSHWFQVMPEKYENKLAVTWNLLKMGDPSWWTFSWINCQSSIFGFGLYWEHVLLLFLSSCGKYWHMRFTSQRNLSNAEWKKSPEGWKWHSLFSTEVGNICIYRLAQVCYTCCVHKKIYYLNNKLGGLCRLGGSRCSVLCSIFSFKYLQTFMLPVR